MLKFKNRFHLFKSSHVQIAGVLLLIFLAVFMLWFNNANSNQSIGATAARVRFNGEYRIGDGQWQTIEEGKHIPCPGLSETGTPFSNTTSFSQELII